MPVLSEVRHGTDFVALLCELYLAKALFTEHEWAVFQGAIGAWAEWGMMDDLYKSNVLGLVSKYLPHLMAEICKGDTYARP